VRVAVTSLQFHDMVTQVLAHMDKRTELLASLLGGLGQLSFEDGKNESADLRVACSSHLHNFKTGLAEAVALVEKVRHNPVSQKSMDTGTVELF
jgi:hypothetical protein